MKEVWKAIPGYEGSYEVSDQGRVLSRRTGKILAANRMRHGYMCVHLYAGGRTSRKVKTIHQLVAMAFIPNPHGCREVNHKNFCRSDNQIANLEWVTRRENVQHAVDGGRRPKNEIKVRGIHLISKNIVTFSSQIAAEIALRGKITGGISGALKRNRPIYGYVWWLA